MHTKQHPYRTYVVGARVPKGSVTKALYWDTADPYHYMRLQRACRPARRTADYDLLIVGGEDHKTGQDDDPAARLRCLEEWTRERFPSIEGFEYRWSGQVMEPSRQPGLRRPQPARCRQCVHHHRRLGPRHDPRHPGRHDRHRPDSGPRQPLGRLYDPGRVTLKPESAQEYIKENVNVAAEYTELLTRRRRSSSKTISRRLRGGAAPRHHESSRVQRRERPHHSSARPFAPTWAAWCTGTALKKAGTVPATAPASTPGQTAQRPRQCRPAGSGVK